MFGLGASGDGLVPVDFYAGASALFAVVVFANSSPTTPVTETANARAHRSAVAGPSPTTCASAPPGWG
jgi:hypothetical protein